MENNNESVFDGLLEKLRNEEWPMVYLFKFILPNDAKTLSLVSSLFGADNEMVFHESKNGNYVSVTVKELMMSAENVISIYKKAAQIKGVITL
jgi:hypothetical protein